MATQNILRSISRRAILATGLGLILILLAATVVVLAVLRKEALERAGWHLGNLATVLAEQTRQSVQAIEILTKATADEVKHRVSGEVRFSDRQLFDHIRERMATLPNVRAMTFIDRIGNAVLHSAAFPTPVVNYNDREYFRVHRERRIEGLHVGEPVFGRLTREWLNMFSRRVQDERGGFRGVVLAAVHMSYFESLFGTLNLGRGGRVFLFRDDGILLATYPAIENAIGRSLAQDPLFKEALAPSVSDAYRRAGLLDQEPRVLAHRRVGDFPLLVTVSSTEDFILGEWRRDAWRIGAGAAAATAFIALALFLLLRQHRIGEAMAVEARDSEQRWSTAMEAAGHGVWDWDVLSGEVYRSLHYHEMLGYANDEIPSGDEGWLQLLHPDDRKLSHQANRACLEGRTDNFSAELRLRCKDGGWMWVLNRGTVIARDERRRALRVLGTITDLTEHRQAQQQLRESEARLNGVISSAMDAIVTMDESQNIVLFNNAAERIFRCPAAEAIGGPLDRFIPERFRAAHRRHVEQFGRTGATTRMMGARLALFGLRGDGGEFPIDASISQITVEGKKLYTVILRDITERKRAEEAVRKERDIAQRYLDIAGAMLVALDTNGKVTLINRKGCDLLGYSEQEIIGQSWFDCFLPEPRRRETRKVFGQFLAGEARLAEFHENPVLTRSGAERLIAWHNRALTDEDGRIIGTLSSGEDITDRKRAEQALERSYTELRELSAAMHAVREAERLRIARELHDELAQWLTAIRMDVSWLASRLPREQAPLVDRAEKMKQVVDTTVAAVRRIAGDLRPVMLDDLGLVAALESLLHDLSQRTGIIVSLEADAGELDFGEPLASSLYRIAQEALTNVARHAQATEAQVAVRIEDGRLVLTVRDNGLGFDPEAAERRKSYGILGIRERAFTLGGAARVERAAGGGTLVEIVIPVARYRRREATDDQGIAG